MELYQTQQAKNYCTYINEKMDAKKMLSDAQALFFTCYESYVSKVKKYDKAYEEYRAEMERRENQKVEKIS